MEFIFNSRQKKVEVFYNNAKEQQALFEFLSQWITYKEDKSSVICDDKCITWTTSSIPYTLTNNNASDHITINYDDMLVPNNISLNQNVTLNNGSASTIDTNALNQVITNSIESNLKKAATAASIKLDENSEEGGYSYLTASDSTPYSSKAERVNFNTGKIESIKKSSNTHLKNEAVDFGKPRISY